MQKIQQPNPGEVLALARRSLAAFAPLLFRRFQLATHHSRIIEKLEAVERGEIKRLMIFIGPRHGKTLLCTQLFPAWYLARSPHKSIIATSYSQDLIEDSGRIVRGFLNDSYTRAAFPELQVSEESNSAKRLSTTAGGNFFAVGRGGPITGRGADLLLIDDPIKDTEEARSETIRKALQDWYSHVAYTRLAPGGAVVLIETRWNVSDLAGFLLREHPEENWDVLSMPAIAETDEPGGRKEGEALWPERFPLETLLSIRSAIGSTAWSALYQARPVPEGGGIFQQSWWQRYSDVPPLNRIVLSLDSAFKTGRHNDYSVCTVWGEAKRGYYILDLWRRRVEFPLLKKELMRLAAEWKPAALLIEDKASGQSLIQELKDGTRLPVIAIRVDSDKESRAHACSPMVEAGRVFLPESAPWIPDFFDEMTSFPGAAHDDITDSVTQALNYFRGHSGGNSWIEFLKMASADPSILRPAKAKEPEAPATCGACESSTPLQVIPGGSRRCQQCGWQYHPAVERAATVPELMMRRQ